MSLIMQVKISDELTLYCIDIPRTFLFTNRASEVLLFLYCIIVQPRVFAEAWGFSGMLNICYDIVKFTIVTISSEMIESRI